MVASGEWCWGTSFYHKRITMDFFYSVVQLHFTIGLQNSIAFLQRMHIIGLTEPDTPLNNAYHVGSFHLLRGARYGRKRTSAATALSLICSFCLCSFGGLDRSHIKRSYLWDRLFVIQTGNCFAAGFRVGRKPIWTN